MTHTPPRQPEEPPRRSVKAFVDVVEEDVATLLFKHKDGEWYGHNLPAGVLPVGVHEGDWLRITFERIPPPQDEQNEALKLRKSLGASDSGEDITL